jgi:pimeloyl-ACP methyl ester carboxylesterase
VLIQGVGVHHTGWQLQLPTLEPHFRCLVFDNRGVGRSAPVAGRFTIDDLAGVDRDALAMRMEALLGHDLADHPPIEGLQLAALRGCDATPGLGRLARIPTMVLGADQDPISAPAVCQAIAAAIPGARLESLAAASHGVNVHQPERVNRLPLEHLLQAETARA